MEKTETALNRQRFVKAGFVDELFKVDKGSRSITYYLRLENDNNF